MIMKSEMPFGNMLNCYLFTESVLSTDETMKYLKVIRLHLNNYISTLKITDYYLHIDVQLFPDSENGNFHKLIANVTGIPKLNFTTAGYNFEQGIAFIGMDDASSGSPGRPAVPGGPKGYVAGGVGGYAAAGAPGHPVIPVGPKGRIEDTPFLPIFNTFNEGFQIGQMG
jgi:hypothetical protein